MPDIAMRFHKDMLVLSAPIETALEKQGIDVDLDREFINIVEPETVRNAYRMEALAGAQCLVTNTEGITQIRLARINMENKDVDLATAALTIVKSLKPQHILASIGPTYLPLDVSSGTSLKQNRDQYSSAARAFGKEGYDGFLLDGIKDPIDMQCALMGIRKESAMPTFAIWNIDGKSDKTGEFGGVCSMMDEYGADVVGFATSQSVEDVLLMVERATHATDKPLLVQLNASGKEGPYSYPDTMFDAALRLRDAGVQFLRAGGLALSAYTGMLVAATVDTDVNVHSFGK